MDSWVDTATAVARRPDVRARMVEGHEALKQALASLPQAVPMGTVPEPVAAALMVWWDRYAAFLEAVTEPMAVSCRAACTHCCHDNPRGVSGIELLTVLRALQALPDGDVRLARMATLSEAMTARKARLGDEEAAWREYKQDHVPCPALSDDGRCTIYASRPLACRMFFAVSDPSWCDRRHPRNSEAVNPQLLPAPAVRDLLWAISERLGLADLPEDLQTGTTALRDRLG